MHKVTEAVKKWCPLVRNLYIEGSDTKTNRPRGGVATSYNADREHNKCIAIHCALWVALDEEHGHCGLIVNPTGD